MLTTKLNVDTRCKKYICATIEFIGHGPTKYTLAIERPPGVATRFLPNGYRLAVKELTR